MTAAPDLAAPELAGPVGPVSPAGATTTGGAAYDRIAQLLDDGDVLVLSGAGLSTESGIPDYRGPSGSLRRSTPMTYQAFTRDPVARHRYWARSYLGWRHLAAARPNAGHHAVAQLQQSGRLCGVITQNVDGLHQAAGTRDVIELHGGLDLVRCLACGEQIARTDIDVLLRELNPDFAARALQINPDGDAELPPAALDEFRMSPCPRCGAGPLKPDVVFFGESVPRDRVERCFALVERAAGLLVLGSSLTVYSGYRFAVRAAKRALPVAIVNQGATRADALASVTLDAPLGGTLSGLARQVTG